MYEMKHTLNLIISISYQLYLFDVILLCMIYICDIIQLVFCYYSYFFILYILFIFFFFKAEDGIRDVAVTGFRRVLFRAQRPAVSTPNGAIRPRRRNPPIGRRRSDGTSSARSPAKLSDVTSPQATSSPNPFSTSVRSSPVAFTRSPKNEAPRSSRTSRTARPECESGSATGSGWARSEERRVGKECRSRWSPYH